MPEPVTPVEQRRPEHMTPDAIRRQQTRAGIFLLAISAVMAYFFMYRPVHLTLAGSREESFSFSAVIGVAFCLYAGVLMILGTFRNDEMRSSNARSQPTLSRKGWWVATGAGLAMSLAVVGWYVCLSALGIHLQWF